MKLLHLKTRVYCAGIVIGDNGRAIKEAPILKWMHNKGEAWIRHHCKKHQIEIEETTEIDPTESLGGMYG